MSVQTILVRYREKGGDLKFEFISGTNTEIEAILKGYLSTKDPHSLMVLGTVSDRLEVGLTEGTEIGLVDGTEVELVEGTEVALVEGSEIQLSQGNNVVGRIIITNADGERTAELDEIDGAQVTIDLPHHEVHEGNSFTASDVDLNVQIVAPKYWLIRVPDNVEFHMKVGVECDTGALLEFFENPTINVDGGVVPWYNNNRNSNNTTNMTCFDDPTVGADGVTRLQVSRVGAGRDKKIGGAGRMQFEWILRSGEEYLIKVTVDANGAELTFTADGYQVVT